MKEIDPLMGTEERHSEASFIDLFATLLQYKRIVLISTGVVAFFAICYSIGSLLLLTRVTYQTAIRLLRRCS